MNVATALAVTVHEIQKQSTGEIRLRYTAESITARKDSEPASDTAQFSFFIFIFHFAYQLSVISGIFFVLKTQNQKPRAV